MQFDAAYGNERMRAFLFLPKHSSPPYQTVVYFPSGEPYALGSSQDLRLLRQEFIIRTGRALVYPVYSGTFERRQVGPGGPNQWRDLVVAGVKDVRRSIDTSIRGPTSITAAWRFLALVPARMWE